MIGTVPTMQGLSATPAYLNVDIDRSGNVVGPF
ncbi:MAG: hypothetical protein KTV45_15500 [Acidimicrobiia bacterium]|nr:hypothetical protein [Acidimicrobiia bacterium]